ncbi:MAG: hypothetical protein EZS28_035102 [Streblomastix strix]|uniref:Uncharacterized protein n=1 Tax=Streblomastix strix TaxID=222440 RepID=A0A5J4UHG7_9EUKA|nr:MAG: hypothetical protein EZS28_035102 [Streblomastix strix]
MRSQRVFWSDAGFSLEQINIPHYLSKEYMSQCPHDKSRRNENFRIYEMEKEYAIESEKRTKRKRLDETILDAETKKKQMNSCNSSSSSNNNQQIQEDWIGKGNTEVP